jgi:DNA polymerase-3 subunit delta'
MDFLSFSEILGQDWAVRFLKKVILREKIPHSYLFIGMPGVGKTSTAVALAQALNCMDPVNGEGCGWCRPCKWLQSGNFGDLVIIRPENQVIKIEKIRELERALGYKPQYGRYRVTVVRQAEQMTEEASNAFLKTLEEPPPGNILILNASDPSQLLSTIVSRCQKVIFRPIPVGLIREWLAQRKGMDEEKAMLLARLCEGSLGRALQMWEDDYLGRRRQYLSELTTLPALSNVEILRLALSMRGRGKKDQGAVSERGSAEIAEVLSLWKTWMRDVLLLKAEAPEDLLINTDYREELKKTFEGSRIDALMEAFHLLDQAEKDLWRSRNLDLLMENLLIALRKRIGRSGSNGEGRVKGGS